MRCFKQELNVSYGGSSLMAVFRATYSSNKCCDYCTKTQDCVSYTFVRDTSVSNSSTCYLTSSFTGSSLFPGAVSVVLEHASA